MLLTPSTRKTTRLPYLFLWLLFLSGGVALGQDWRVLFHRLSIEEGLSQTSAFCIAQDRTGYLWVGTKEGLNRYDGYTFKVFRADPQVPGSISGNYIAALYEDRQGTLWVGTYGSGLNRYNPSTGSFEAFRARPEEPDTLSHNRISCMLEDSRGRFWVGTPEGLNLFDRKTGRSRRFLQESGDHQARGARSVMSIYEDGEGTIWVGTFGGLFRFDGEGRGFRAFSHDPQNAKSLSNNMVFALGEDRKGQFWVGTFGGGLNRMDRGSGTFETFRHDPADPTGLSHDYVVSIRQKRDGLLWIGTNGGGVNRLNLETGVFHKHRHDPIDPFSLSNDNVLCVFEDRAGIMWVGTFGGGLNRFDAGAAAFVSYRPGGMGPTTLSHRNIWALLEDENRELWIGTNGGGLNRYHQKNHRYRVYRHDPNDPTSLGDDRVLVLQQDRALNIWAGTFGGGLSRYDRSSDRFRVYRHEPNNPDSLSMNIVFALAASDDGGIWVGTEGGGACYFDPASESFTCYQHDPGDPQSLSHNAVFALLEDTPGQVWMGTYGGGLNRLSPSSGDFTHFRNDPQKPDSLSNNRVYALHEDGNQRLWVGTAGGLNRFMPQTQSFETWRGADGLPNEVVYSIVSDCDGQLWLGTNRGLVGMDPERETFTVYGMGDGLLSEEFNQGASFVSADCQVFFGGIKGFNSFSPKQLALTPFQPPVVITEFRIANKPVLPRVYQLDSPLTHTIEETRNLVLNHQQTMFTFEFSALDFAFPSKNRYAYRLEGYNDEWLETDAANRRATYTNLPAGAYVFRVKGTNHDGIWNEQGATLEVRILPAPWLTPLAKVFYVMVVVFLFFWALYLTRRRLRREQRYARQQNVLARQAEELAENSEQVAAQLRQLDTLKNEFLANTSHELRTPLHGIIGLAESLRDGACGAVSEKGRLHLDMIAAGGRRLASLVNDILDFSRMRSASLELRSAPLNLHALVEVICHLSRPLIQGKDLQIQNEIDPDVPLILGDESRMHQIMHNLVGNAIKFTEHGEVVIRAAVDGLNLRVSVADTGIGLAEESMNRIFKSFEQVDASTSRSFGGTGLGLAVTRKLVELHGGEISVSSHLGEGSTFFFTIPLYRGDQKPALRAQTLPVLSDPESTADKLMLEVAPGAKAVAPVVDSGLVILIVDDEPVNRLVLVSHLQKCGYHLLEADGGEEALAVLEAERVDLLLLDVMMPRLSGYEVCRKVRETHSMQELPIIFLTARTRVADMVEGFEMEANDYLTKPIRKEELLARVQTHLRLYELNKRLEQKVTERTQALHTKNKQLARRFHELETLERIVKSINHEMELKRVVDTVLEQGLALFPEAEKASFLLYDKETRIYRVIGAVGYDLEKFGGYELSRQTIVTQLTTQMEERAEGVFVGRDLSFAMVPVPEGLSLPKSMIVLRLPLEGQPAGLLCFDNLSNTDGFREAELSSISRFREHLIAALGKAMAFREMVAAQQRLLDASRLAGMTEMAVNVQHNIGNTLNSVITSVHGLRKGLGEEQRWLELMDKTLKLLPETPPQLADFFDKDERAQHVARVITKAHSVIFKHWKRFFEETAVLQAHLDRISDDLNQQRRMLGESEEPMRAVDLNELVRKAVEEKYYLLKEKGVAVSFDLADLPLVDLEPNKFKRCVYYLLENAWESICERGVAGRIECITQRTANQVVFSLSDNGKGLAEELLPMVFRHGYTHREDKRGFGLHYCANAMTEMGGQIKLLSEGEGRGVTVVLSFPANTVSIPGAV